VVAIGSIVFLSELIQAQPVPPESNTAVVVDTTSYLPEELIERHGIHRVSLYVTLDGEQKRESEIGATEYDDFYERLRRSDDGATTSQ
jgi:fatty acid-binding protein DegV